MYKPLTTVFHHSFKIEALSLDWKSVHASLYIKVYPISVYSYTGNYHPERLTSVIKLTFSLTALDHHYQLVVTKKVQSQGEEAFNSVHYSC